MAGRTRAAAGLLLLTFIVILLSATAAPAFAKSSPRVLRCPVVKRFPKYVIISHASPDFRVKLLRGQHRIKVRGMRYKVVKLTLRRAKLRWVKPHPATPTTPTPTPTPTATPTATPTTAPTTAPTPSPSPSATVIPTSSPALILTASDVTLLRQRVAAGEQPYTGAWQFFRDGKVKAALAATPTVDVGPTNAFTYTLLDTDSRHARNLAVAYAATGSTSYAAKARDFVVGWAAKNHPASYAFTGDYQGGYHQSYGAFSFAFAYDLTRDAGVYSADDHAVVQAWFRTWASVMKGYQDNFAQDYWFTHSGRHAYDWPGSTLTYDQTDFYMGRDTAASPAAAWLAAAIVSGDAAEHLHVVRLLVHARRAGHPACGDASGQRRRRPLARPHPAGHDHEGRLLRQRQLAAAAWTT